MARKARLRGKGWGSRSKAVTTRYFKELMRLKRRAGLLTSEVIVEAARPKTSPLHDYFEWDDTRAARAFRMEQAARLIRTVCVHVSGGGGGESIVHVFHNVESRTASGGNVSHYITVQDMRDSPPMRAYVVAQALAHLRSWTAEYESVKGLGRIASVITAALDRIERGRSAA